MYFVFFDQGFLCWYRRINKYQLFGKSGILHVYFSQFVSSPHLVQGGLWLFSRDGWQLIQSGPTPRILIGGGELCQLVNRWIRSNISRLARCEHRALTPPMGVNFLMVSALLDIY